MSCLINDVRKFKEAKQTMGPDNVVGIHGDSPVATLHHARIEEANSVDVSISVSQSNSIHEDNIMKSVNNETNEMLNDVMPDTNETLNDPGFDLNNAASNVISEDEVIARMKKIQRFDMSNTVVSSAIMMASAAITAKATDRSVGGAVFISGMLTAFNISVVANNQSCATGNKWIAKNCTDQEVAKRSSHSVVSAVGTLSAAVVMGAIIGRLFTRKNITE